MSEKALYVDLFVAKYTEGEVKARELFHMIKNKDGDYSQLILVLPESMSDLIGPGMIVNDEGQLYLDQGFEENAFVVVIFKKQTSTDHK